MEERVENLVFLERAEPKRRFVRSDGALYVLLLIFVLGVILLGNRLAERLDWPRFYVQISLYVLLLAAGYWIYRTQLTAFRYMVTDRMLTVTRLVGKKERADAHVHLSDIKSIKPYAQLSEADEGKRLRLYTGRRADSVAVTVAEGGTKRILLLSLTGENRGKLIAAWKSSLK